MSEVETSTIALDDMSMGHGVGRAAVIGATIGFFVMAAVAATVAIFGGMELRNALGLGAFAGFFAGPGFGAMFGGITAITRNERNTI